MILYFFKRDDGENNHKGMFYIFNFPIGVQNMTFKFMVNLIIIVNTIFALMRNLQLNCLCLDFVHRFFPHILLGSFINYVGSRGRGGWKNLYILLLWGWGVKPILK
jgi:hypothetical protein